MASDDYKFAYIMDELDDVGWVRGMCDIVDDVSVSSHKIRETRLGELDLKDTLDKWDENADKMKEMHDEAVNAVAHYATRVVKYRNIIGTYKNKLDDAQKEIASYKKLMKNIVEENSRLELDKANLKRECDRLELIVNQPSTETFVEPDKDDEEGTETADEGEEEERQQMVEIMEEVVVTEDQAGDLDDMQPIARKKLTFDDVLMSS